MIEKKVSMNIPARIFYIDNLRIFLISLVVLHHLSITYGAPGDWYYNESKAGFPEILPLAMFVATNQSFFMGMFFFVSAFFILPSLNRKGTGRFIRERLLRLGVPLLFFYFVLAPLTAFIRSRFISGDPVSLTDYWINQHGVGFGPLWFVEALLIFTLIFLLIKPFKIKIIAPFPGTTRILLTIFLVGLLQFIIRIWLPVGWSMPFTSFQFPFFVQYILLFALGIVAYQNNWLASVSFLKGKNWFIFAQVLIFVGFPLLFVFGGKGERGIDAFMGGFSWQNFAYALWEQLTGFSLIIGLTGLFQKYFNSQNKVTGYLSGSAYGVFVFHAPILVGISAIFVSWQAFPVIKLVALAPVALVLCFLIAGLVKKIPMAGKVF